MTNLDRHVQEYELGSYVRITCERGGHKFGIDEVVCLVDFDPGDNSYVAFSDAGESWWVWAYEFVLTEWAPLQDVAPVTHVEFVSDDVRFTVDELGTLVVERRYVAAALSGDRLVWAANPHSAGLGKRVFAVRKYLDTHGDALRVKLKLMGGLCDE